MVKIPSSCGGQLTACGLRNTGDSRTYDEEPLPAREAGDTTHVQDTVGNDTRDGGGDHVAEEEPGETLADLIALVPASDGEQSGRDETSFGKTGTVSLLSLERASRGAYPRRSLVAMKAPRPCWKAWNVATKPLSMLAS
jgi:hypothetical protein